MSARLISRLLISVIVMGIWASLSGCSTINRSLYPVQPPGYAAEDPRFSTVETEDGVKLAIRELRTSGNRHVVIFSHGNAEDIGYAEPSLQELHGFGVDVVAYDYRGYGHSEGKPSERGTYRDIEAVYNYVRRTDPQQGIVVMGRSLGGGPSTELARVKPVAGLILESTYTSILDVVKLGWLGKIYHNLGKIADVDCPVFIVHGDRDQVIPFEHSVKLHARAREPKTFLRVPGGPHDLRFEDAGYGQKLRSWLAALPPRSQNP